MGGFVFLGYRHDGYNIERLKVGATDQILGITARNDNFYGVGGGVTRPLAKGWSLSPEMLCTRDQSNILAVNYS